LPLAEIRDTTDRIVIRYNQYPSADINGDIRPFSSGQALTDGKSCKPNLSGGIEFAWTDCASAEAGGKCYMLPLCPFAFHAVSARELASPLSDPDRPMSVLCALAGI
jgi:hypothetical protein